ncbi:UxaA family hydrolase [Halococcus salifodinae]|uniref:Dehydratase n=1 Tax=Halococcus salifodinae DSM 8989 TaxID=1227456 RepID=M0MTT4_9EURY|nr:UxaA family hydrolase [Halococcus salifodinae]EMA48174.1 dehydratase [Halococcus salifodinae DSM 8989]
MRGDVFGDVALRMARSDNVATAIADLDAGTDVATDANTVTLAGDVAFGHKFALLPIAAGEGMRKYGEVIGRATDDVDPGEHVHVHNCESTRGRGDLAATADERGEEA